MTLFQISNLTTRYGKGQDVLHSINTEIQAGTFTVLIGPNGSGKSTLLRTLAGLQAYSGSVRLDGREVRAISRRQFAQTVSVVPQDFRPAYPFSVWEVLNMGRLPYRTFFAGNEPDSETRILNAASRMCVSHLLQRDVTTLSGGEAQRVLLACVLVQDTPVLLLDEPTSALDPNQAVHVLALLRELTHNNGKTVIAVTHDINVPLPFADRYIALRDGRLCSSDSIKNLNGNVLQNLYGTPFESYHSERGEVMWCARAD